MPDTLPEDSLETADLAASVYAAEVRRSAMLESALDAVVAMDHHGLVSDFNPAAEDTFGYSRAEAIGRPMADLIIPPSLREQHWAGLARYLETGEAKVLGRRLELTAMRKGGEEFPVELAISRVDLPGAPLFTAYLRDITDRRRIEQRLAAQYAVAQTLTEASSLEHASRDILGAIAEALDCEAAGLWRVDADAEVLRLANAWPIARVVEDSPGPTTLERGIGLPGRVWETGEPIWIPDITAEPGFPRSPVVGERDLRAAFGAPIQLGEHVLGVMEFFTKESTSADQDLIDLLRAIGRQVGQYIGRTRAEALLGTEQPFRLMIENVTDYAIFMLDPAGRIITWNAGAERLKGYAAEEIIGQHLSRFYPEEDLAWGKPEHELRQATSTGRFEDEGWRIRKDGSRFWANVVITAARDRTGHLQGFVKVTRDMTERKQLEERARLLAGERAARSMAESQRRRFELLARAGGLLAGSLDPQATLAGVADIAVPDLADWCIVYAQREDGSIDRLALSHASPEGAGLAVRIKDGFRIDPDADGGVPKVIRTGESIYVRDASPEDLSADVTDPAGFLDLAAELGPASWICVPLHARGRTLGAISFVHAESGRRYEREDLVLAEELAHHAALAIDNAALYRAEQQSRRSAERAAARTSLLQTVTAALSEALNRDEVADTIIERGLQAFGAGAGAIALLDDRTSKLELFRAVGYPEDILGVWEGFELATHAPIADAARTGNPLMVRSAADRLSRYPNLVGTATGYEATAAIPLLFEGRSIGAMALSFAEARDFSDEDEAFMLALGRQCAQALERARLYESELDARSRAEAAQERLAFLSQASEVLASSLDYGATLSELARLAVPRLADWCTVDILAEDGSIQQLAIAHVDPEKVEYAKMLREKNPPNPDDKVGLPHVLRSGQPEIYPEISEEFILENVEDEELRLIIKELQLHSLMIVPLTAGGRTLGAMTFVGAESGRTYDDADLRLAQDLARRAAVAIDNARIYQERDHIARTLQQTLLPPELPEIPGMQLAARYHPAGAGNEVGGDFYDVFETGDGTWGIAIGDVCGKGPDAAALMGIARHTLRATAMKETRPSRILNDLNEALRRQSTDGRFLTVAYMRLRTGQEGARLTVCCAGHPLPVVLRANGTLETGGRPGTLLGLFPDPDLLDQPVDLGPGDALILYTDGVMEGPPFDEGNDLRLSEVLVGSAGGDAEAITAAIENEILTPGRTGHRDDMAFLVLRMTP